jgi:neural Wiskott-Aldrich syndrome protein
MRPPPALGGTMALPMPPAPPAAPPPAPPAPAPPLVQDGVSLSRSAQAGMSGGAPTAPFSVSSMPSLAAYYGGQRHPVNKDRFIIGRGQKASDLTIKDPNISRQHALVEYVGGQYFIVDMGSTNGIEVNGQRVSRKAIAEGDVVRICDHDVRFSYR